jgi:23S rRNA (guanosine2251-2'-O)-methyltransferase
MCLKIGLKELSMTEWCTGKRAIMELLDHRSHRVSEVFIAGEANQFQELKNKVLSLGITFRELSKEDFLELFSELPSLNHQWICGLITPATSVSSKQLFEKALKNNNPVIVALDQVQDPQNLGAIFRVCECAGVSGIIFPERRSAGVSTIVRRVSAGATEFVPFSRGKKPCPGY